MTTQLLVTELSDTGKLKKCSQNLQTISYSHSLPLDLMDTGKIIKQQITV